MLTLFTDTDTDITPEEAKHYGYRLISMPYSIDGETIYPYEDFDVFDSHPFYERLRAGTLPSTSAVNPEKYKQYFEPEFAAGNDILYVSFSSAMSGTFNFMEKALEELREKYPERKFTRIDTKGITIEALNLVKEIGDRALAGDTLEELVAFAEKEIPHFAIYFYADNLKFFQRSGRVNGITATMGNLLGIRPIIYMDDDGKMISIGKERGRQNAINRLIQYVIDLGDDLENHRILIAHTDAPAVAEEIEKTLRERLPNGDKLNIEIVVCNPTAGSHCGPDGVGVCFHAIHR